MRRVERMFIGIWCSSIWKYALFLSNAQWKLRSIVSWCHKVCESLFKGPENMANVSMTVCVGGQSMYFLRIKKSIAIRGEQVGTPVLIFQTLHFFWKCPKLKQTYEENESGAVSYLLHSGPLPASLWSSHVSLWGEESALWETETCIYPNQLLGSLYQSENKHRIL